MEAKPATFITIPLSHFCEKARWGLDRAALPYREEPHLPLFSRLATWRRGGGTVPVLVHGKIRLSNSTAVLVHADSWRGGDVLYPRDTERRREVDALESRFDQDLGPHVRRWAYAHLVPDLALLRELWSRGAPKGEALWLPLIVPLARKLLLSGYKISPAGAARSLERFRQVFRDMDARLADGRRFLVAEKFTAADLTFASLAAPVLFPDQCRAAMPALDDVPAVMHSEVLRLRDTVAGKFALRIYREERAVSQ